MAFTFEDSPLPLTKWLPAVWLIVNAKNGISSCEMARTLGVTQKTAWHMGHRIRKMIHGGKFTGKMSGIVEVDETFIGGLSRNMHAWKRDQKRIQTAGRSMTEVQGFLQRDDECSKVRVEVVDRKTRTPGKLQAGIVKNVEPLSQVFTDQAPH